MDLDLWARIGAAITTSREAGGSETARSRLLGLWDETPTSEHALRCVIAHYVADLESSVADEQSWDERALSEYDAAAAHDWEAIGIADPAGMQASLHLNLADSAHRDGDADAATHHLAHAETHVGRLGDDAYGATVRTGLRGLRERLTSSRH